MSNMVHVQLYSLYCEDMHRGKGNTLLVMPARTARRLVEAGFIRESQTANPPLVAADENYEHALLQTPGAWIERA